MTTPHPHEVKFRLEQRLQQLSATIVGLHSIVVEGDTVHVNYDILTDQAEDGVLVFEYQRPELVGRTEIAEFCRWLSETGHCGETLH